MFPIPQENTEFGRVSILVETFLLKIPRAIFFTMPLPDKNQVLAAVA